MKEWLNLGFDVIFGLAVFSFDNRQAIARCGTGSKPHGHSRSLANFLEWLMCEKFPGTKFYNQDSKTANDLKPAHSTERNA